MLPLLLGLLVSSADARPDPALLRARLLAQATFAFDRYVFAGKNFPAGKARHDPALADAFGADSVPLDMAKFAQMLLNKGAYGGRRFFREETFEKVMLPGPLTKLAPTKRTFGLGRDGSAKRFGHGTASGASFSIDAERQLIFVMTRNKYGKNQDRYNGLIWKAIDEGVVR